MLEEMSPNQRIRYAFTLFVFAGAFAVIDIPLIIVMSSSIISWLLYSGTDLAPTVILLEPNESGTRAQDHRFSPID
jgi:hypothetical protein